MRTTVTVALLLCAPLSGCAKYQYAKNVKMLSYEDDVRVGKSMGPIRGESCQKRVFGYPITEPATLDKAVADARDHHKVRYLNNVSSETTGFNAVFYSKSCVAVKGTGYR